MKINYLLFIVLLASCSLDAGYEMYDESVTVEDPVYEEPEIEILTEEDPVIVLFEEEPEEEIIYTDYYNLFGVVTGASPDVLSVSGGIILVNCVEPSVETVISGTDRIYQIVIKVDVSDQFLFINGNYQNFFGDDLSRLSYEELEKAAEILSLYPENGILELMEYYYD